MYAVPFPSQNRNTSTKPGCENLASIRASLMKLARPALNVLTCSDERTCTVPAVVRLANAAGRYSLMATVRSRLESCAL